MRVLVTGFTPFGGESINPSYEVVKLLPNTIGDKILTKAEITTEFGKSKEQLFELMARGFDAVICIGQAGGRNAITIEKVAINYAIAHDYDPNGVIQNNTIAPSGETAYFSTLPITDMVARINDIGIPCGISYTAGTFVCNYIMYNLLCATANTTTKAGFIHIPYCTAQGVGKSQIPPTMELDVMAKAIATAIECL